MSGIGQIKLLEALRSPDPQLFKEVTATYNLSNAPGILEISVGSAPSVFAAVLEWYLQQSRDINEVNPETGNTALHTAVQENNLAAAHALVSQPTINDTIPNNAGEIPLDCTQSDEMAQMLTSAQHKYLREVSIRLKTAFQHRDLATLEQIYSNPRVDELIDLNGIDPDTGNAVLHDAAAANDLALVKFILTHKGDPLVRNANKQAPVDIAKSEEVQRELAHAAKTQTVNSGSQVLEGFLKKYTNITQGYRSRWFVLEDGKLRYYKNPHDKVPRSTIDLSDASIKVQSSVNKGFELKTPGHKLLLRAAHANEANRWVWALQNAITAQKKPRTSSSSRGTGRIRSPVPAATLSAASAGNVGGHARTDSVAYSTKSNRFIDDLDAGFFQSDDDDDDDDVVVEPTPPTAVIASIDALATLVKENPNPSTETALETIAQIKSDVLAWRQFYARITRGLKSKIIESEEQQRFWAKNCRELEIKLERAENTIYSSQARDAQDEDEDEDDDIFYDTVDEYHRANSSVILGQGDGAATADGPGSEDTKNDTKSGATAGTAAAAATTAAAAGTAASAASSDPSDSKPAAETTETAKNESSEDTTGMTPSQAEIESEIAQENSFAGYEGGPRARLTMDKDNRPKISLWGVLKSLVGKDMTKMALPVSFNECTNLLQRSAEDMEYVDLLDKAAAAVDDPGLRMAYIAAFAASSYSSTINRVAKPFNPLLGETYEYCRPDKDFRLVSEQVSHHPPVGALHAESPRWTFYGNSQVKSKFTGRSVDIVPVGLWYITLRPNDGSDVKEELYTFRKVTSSVIGIMVGNPVVDNYGTMEIKNHTTGVTCTLEFQPRGWRGNSAYRVDGHVRDAKGKELYSVGGKWDDKIYAMKADSGSKAKLTLWQVHSRPSAPFNLTAFAITLNAIPDELKKWLPSTDTRLRPDQRDMEEGRYDQAETAKQRVENKQRLARKTREDKGIEYEPMWFKRDKHPVTGEDYYTPVNGYWEHRAKQDWNTPDIF